MKKFIEQVVIFIIIAIMYYISLHFWPLTIHADTVVVTNGKYIFTEKMGRVFLCGFISFIIYTIFFFIMRSRKRTC